MSDPTDPHEARACCNCAGCRALAREMATLATRLLQIALDESPSLAAAMGAMVVAAETLQGLCRRLHLSDEQTRLVVDFAKDIASRAQIVAVQPQHHRPLSS